MAARTVVDRLRRPEYTGENRCLPCTAVNVLLAAVLGGAVALASPPAGAAVLVAALGAIYLRGYLVPGTPTLTARYFPGWLLRAFDKAERAPHPDDDDFDAAAVLRWAGAIPDEDDLELTDDFRAAWSERAAALRDDEADRRDAAAAMVGVDPETVDVDIDPVLEAASIRDAEGRNRGFWISDAAIYADLAADALLAARYDAWRDLDLDRRNAVLSTLRAAADACPLCGGAVESFVDEGIGCCTDDVEVRECSDCGDRLIEIDPEAGATPRSRRCGLRPAD